MSLEDFTDGRSLFFKALNCVLNVTSWNASSQRSGAISATHDFLGTLCWENYLLIEYFWGLFSHYFPRIGLCWMYQKTPILANLTPLPALCFSSEQLQCRSRQWADPGSPDLHQQRRHLHQISLSNTSTPGQNSLFTFYKTESVIAFTNCPISTSVL